MPVWPGDPPVLVEPVSRVEDGDVAAVSRLALGTHTGTHVDPPAHFLRGGATVDELPLDVLIGPAVVADLSDGGLIDAPRLERLGVPFGTARLLLHTASTADTTPISPLTTDPGKKSTPERSVLSRDPGREVPGAGGAAPLVRPTGLLTPDGAVWLVEHGVRLVGVDTLSIEPATTDFPVHRVLLEAGVVIVEGLDLSAAPAGGYQLVCLPLRIAGGDGAPARAVLLPLEKDGS
jgi:arylformamidase